MSRSSFLSMSSLFLKASTECISTTSLGKLFHPLTTHMLNKCLLISNLDLSACSLWLCPCMYLAPMYLSKNTNSLMSSFPVRTLFVSFKSPLVHLYSRVVRLSLRSLCSYGMHLIPFTSLMVHIWTFSMIWMSLFRNGDQTWTEYSKCCYTNDFYKTLNPSQFSTGNCRC